MRIPSPKARRRSAFTLIELLVVIAIIAILGALTAGAIHRLVGSQSLKRSEATVKKTQTGFEGQWKAVIDDAKQDINNHKVKNVMGTFNAMGVNDSDAANALYVKMKLKIEFPQTFNEARNPNLGPFGLQPKAVYTQEIGNITAGTPEEQAAVLLFLSLSQTRRGVTFNVDEMGGSVKVLNLGGRDFKVIVDAWGTPITFNRFTLNAAWAVELTQYGGGDPQDPYRKLQNLPNTTPLFTKNAFQSLLADQFNGQYHAPVIRSAGPDKSFATTNDDLLGFRLMKEGQRGN